MFTNKRWLILAIVSSALFLIVVDMTVLYTALPRLTHDLQANASQKLWIVNSYALVVAGLLPGFGTLGDRIGHKKLFISGLVVFGLASLLAAYSWTPAVLIFARVLLAVGAALMMPATLSIIRLTFSDERERSLAIGIWSAVSSGGAALGPVLGGVMLEYFWWGSVFLINVPIVLVALVLAVFLVPDHGGRKDRSWDLIGSLQIMVSLIAIAYAIKTFSKPVPSYESVGIAALVGIVAGIMFVRRQRQTTQPLIDFKLFSDPRFLAGVVAALVASLALTGVELVLSQRLQLVLEMTPLEAGLFILPIPLAAFVAGPLAGLMLARLGASRIMVGGLLISAFGLLMLWLGQDGMATTTQIAGLLTLGFGVGSSMTAASSAIMIYAPRDKAGMAASVEEVSFELGGAIGIAILGSVMTAVYSASFIVPDTLPVSAAVRDSLDTALIVSESLEPSLARELVELARLAFDKSFSAVVAMAIVMLVATAATIGWITGRMETAE